MSVERQYASSYMQWAKTQTHSKYNLALSDIAHLSLQELPVDVHDFEITGAGGYGYLPLVQAIAGRYGVEQEGVVLSIGTSLANHIAMAALIGPGDEVLLEHPTYELLSSTLGYFGADVKRFSRRFENRFMVDVDELRHAVSRRTKLIVLTNLHNPSSAFTDESTLVEIGTLAAEVGAHVLVDEVYLDAAFALHPRSAVYLGKQFVTTSSLTKVYGLSGLRCGWILAESSLAERMRRLSDLFHSSHVHVAERLSLAAFRHIDVITERSKQLLHTNGVLLNRFYASRLDVISIPHQFGLVSFPRIGTVDGGELCNVLQASFDTSVVPGRFFDMPHHIRIGIGSETPKFEEGLRRLGLALDRLSR